LDTRAVAKFTARFDRGATSLRRIWQYRRPADPVSEGFCVFPDRIVCLTEETVETFYLLGEQDRIVGISGYVVRPPQARREKPRVSACTSANIDKILALKPDLILTFSDLQANIVADLIRRELNVHAFNQRTVAKILDMIRMLGAMVDAGARAEQLVAELGADLA
jgi:iron complex transport system substrate-binding protein